MADITVVAAQVAVVFPELAEIYNGVAAVAESPVVPCQVTTVRSAKTMNPAIIISSRMLMYQEGCTLDISRTLEIDIVKLFTVTFVIRLGCGVLIQA